MYGPHVRLGVTEEMICTAPCTARCHGGDEKRQCQGRSAFAFTFLL